MNTDFRRNVLATISQLLKKINHLRHLESHNIRQSYSHGMQADVELLRSDLILILNQNFYLQCKLAEKEKTVSQLEKKYFQLEESSKLNIRMAKTKYQKLLHNLKYEQFLHKDSEKKLQMAKEINFCIQEQFKHYSSVKAQQLPTPKKIINLRNVKSSLDNKQTLQKNIRNQWVLEQQVIITQDFDLETRLAQGAKSQQINKADQNFSGQKAKSNQLSKNQSNSKKRNRGSSANGRKSPEEGENCKQQELKMLVTQQFKVLALKQRYFCTDLQ